MTNSFKDGVKHDNGISWTIQISTGGGVTIQTQLGTSGKPDLEMAWLEMAMRTFATFCLKQKDYGSENIQRHGLKGITVRLDDKLARLTNLLNKEEEPANEPLYDTVQDIADYGLIGMLVLTGRWE